MTDFICPACRGPLVGQGPDVFLCPKDHLTFPLENGIWRFLTAEQMEYFDAFIRDYETIRDAEGRGSSDPTYYRALPFQDLSGAMPDMWRMRAASYRTLQKVLRTAGPGPLAILDLGAGSGWLSNRLAAAGHKVDAVDLLTNDWDGLGAHRHYASTFRPVQASFDTLPFDEGSYDLALFNASFHYSVDYAHTIAHVLSVVKHGSALVLIDTPFYTTEISGVRMVRERAKRFKDSYGFRSDALPLENYLTYNRLHLLAETARLDVKIFHPWFGFKHWLAPFRARLRGHREPARFPVVVLRRRD